MSDHRSVALSRAHAAKLAHAQLRAAIRASGRRAGARRAAETVQASDSTMRFFDLLRAIPTVGEGHARRMLGRARISPVARVNSDLITAHQRDVLIGELIGYASRAKDDEG